MAGVKVSIYFTLETWEALLSYITAKYGKRNVLSMTVDQAVKLYLAREEKRL